MVYVNFITKDFIIQLFSLIFFLYVETKNHNNKLSLWIIVEQKTLQLISCLFNVYMNVVYFDLTTRYLVCDLCHHIFTILFKTYHWDRRQTIEKKRKRVEKIERIKFTRFQIISAQLGMDPNDDDDMHRRDMHK